MYEYFLAAAIPFLLLMSLGPLLINILKKLNFGQQIRNQGPSSHLKKEGIPTMGGVLIILAILFSTLILLQINARVFWTLLLVCGMGFIGFLDDMIKIKTRRSLGLMARYKITGQFFLALLLSLYIYYYSEIAGIIFIPLIGQVDIGIWIIPVVLLTVIGTVNAVNITDGLDGLASGTTAIVCSSLALLNAVLNYHQLSLLGLIVTGACIGFIWYNSHPAQVFMGDVGSLALGGAVAAMAVFSGSQLFLFIIGGVFVMETLSVMVQVLYFKITGGRRIFNMTPIHHHFELEGLDESKIVARFLIINLLLAGTGIILFFLTI